MARVQTLGSTVRLVDEFDNDLELFGDVHDPVTSGLAELLLALAHVEPGADTARRIREEIERRRGEVGHG